MKYKVVVDTSALVSPEVVELVIKVLKYFEIIIPMAVKSELEEMATYNDIHGAAAKRILIFVESGEIVVKEVNGYEKHFFNADLGEAQSLELANKICADYLVCDDIKCFWYLENNFKKTVFSVFMVRFLCNLNEMKDSKGLELINKMRERRTWANNIIYQTAKKFWNIKS